MTLCKHCGFRPAENNASKHCRVCHSYFSAPKMSPQSKPASNLAPAPTNYTAPATPAPAVAQATPAVKTQRSETNDNRPLDANNRFQNVRSKPLNGGTSNNPVRIVRCMGYKCNPAQDASNNRIALSMNSTTTPVNGETTMAKTSTSAASTSTKTQSKADRRIVHNAIKGVPAFVNASIPDQKAMLDIACEMYADGWNLADICQELKDDTDAIPAVETNDKQTIDVNDVLATAAVEMAKIKGLLGTVGYTVANPAFVLLPVIAATVANVERQAAPDVNKGSKGKSGQKTTTRKAKKVEKDTPVADATASNKPAATPTAAPAVPTAPVASEKPTEPKPVKKEKPVSGKATQATRDRAKELGIKPYWLPNQTEASLLAKIKEAEAKQTVKPAKAPKAAKPKQEEKASTPSTPTTPAPAVASEEPIPLRIVVKGYRHEKPTIEDVRKYLAWLESQQS